MPEENLTTPEQEPNKEMLKDESPPSEKDKQIADLTQALHSLKERFQKYDQIEQTGIDIPAMIKAQKDLEEERSKNERRDLELKGKYEELYRRDREDLERKTKLLEEERSSLQTEHKQRIAEVEQARIDLEVLSVYGANNVVQPQQLLSLTRHFFKRDSDGKILAEDGFKRFSVTEFIGHLRGQTDYRHFFVNLAAIPTPTTDDRGQPLKNPWKKGSVNLTEQGRIVRANPELAKRLQKEAEKS